MIRIVSPHPWLSATARHRSRLCRAAQAALARCAVGLILVTMAAGCGTTRWSDSQRTATEQLLISSAIDQAVSQVDFTVLQGLEVYFDPQYIQGSVEAKYLESTLRQHLLASGCILRDSRDQATVIVEARVGTVGTDRNDLMFGVPQLQLPSLPGVPGGMPSSVPEIALAKRTNQSGVAKLAVFAYDRQSGRPVWQSGEARTIADAKHSWFFGAGPFQKGSIYSGTTLAGDKLGIPLLNSEQRIAMPEAPVPVTSEVIFEDSDVPDGAAPVEMDIAQGTPEAGDADADTPPAGADSNEAASGRELADTRRAGETGVPTGAADAPRIVRLPPTARPVEGPVANAPAAVGQPPLRR